jgi:organic radical activating enzyme
MTDWCNYACSYCISPTKRWVYPPTEETVQTKYIPIAKSINNFIQATKVKTNLTLVGGEVCFVNLPLILDSIQTPYLNGIAIVTNFSADKDYWTQLISYGNDRKLRINIVASYHKEQCSDEQGFIEKVLSVKNNIVVKCVLNNDNIEAYKPFLETLINRGVLCRVVIERDLHQHCKILTKENFNYYKSLTETLYKNIKPAYTLTLRDGTKHGYNLSVSILNDMGERCLDTKGFFCDAGMHNLRVNPDGTVSKAVCDFLKQPIGHISNITDYCKEPVLCKVKTFCSLCSQTSISRNKEDLI